MLALISSYCEKDTNVWSNLNRCYVLQKTVTANAATVSDYVGYLTKGQIPPKVCFLGYSGYFFNRRLVAKVKRGVGCVWVYV